MKAVARNAIQDGRHSIAVNTQNFLYVRRRVFRDSNDVLRVTRRGAVSLLHQPGFRPAIDRKAKRNQVVQSHNDRAWHASRKAVKRTVQDVEPVLSSTAP